MSPAGRDPVREERPGAVPEAPLRRSSFLFRLTRLLGFSEHRCPACGTPVEDDGAGGSGPEAGMLAHGLCPACARALGPYVGGRCRACGLPLPWPAAGQPLLCGDCLASPPPWQGLALHGQYHGPLRQLILRFKHGGKPALAFLLAGMLADAASCLPLPDAVLGIPQHEDHLRRRGYNQAHELAVALGLLLSLPVRPDLLRRPADSPTRQASPRPSGSATPPGAFRLPTSGGCTCGWWTTSSPPAAPCGPPAPNCAVPGPRAWMSWPWRGRPVPEAPLEMAHDKNGENCYICPILPIK